MNVVILLITVPLVASLAWHAIVFSPRTIELTLAALLVVTTAALMRAAARNDAPLGGWRLMLLVSCVFAAALAATPGAFLTSPLMVAAVIIVIAAVTGAFLGKRSRRLGRFGFWTVIYAAVAAASLEVGLYPTIARLLIRH